jgi:hypothetical protein
MSRRPSPLKSVVVGLGLWPLSGQRQRRAGLIQEEPRGRRQLERRAIAIALVEGQIVAVRADTAVAKPEIYEALEERGVKRTIPIPANDSL